jgi:ABC-type uncharacterized transport system auxiliary subunit
MAGSAEQATPELRLRMGKVSAASYLDRRLVYRKDELEFGYYEGLRWTESPEDYLRRGLEDELFERMGITQVVSGPAPTLDVELVSFEEVKEPKKHVGRVVVNVSLSDDRVERFRRTFVVEKPIEHMRPEGAVDAISRALLSTLDEVAHQTRAELSAEKEELARARKQAEKEDAASAAAVPPAP